MGEKHHFDSAHLVMAVVILVLGIILSGVLIASSYKDTLLQTVGRGGYLMIPPTSDAGTEDPPFVPSQELLDSLHNFDWSDIGHNDAESREWPEDHTLLNSRSWNNHGHSGIESRQWPEGHTLLDSYMQKLEKEFGLS